MHIWKSAVNISYEKFNCNKNDKRQFIRFSSYFLDPCAEYDGIGALAEPELTVCCAKTCGSCGGGGCTSRPGGTQNCCTGNIKDNGKVCGLDGNKAPCIIPGI